MSAKNMVFVLRSSPEKGSSYIGIPHTQCGPWPANKDFLLTQTCVQEVFSQGYCIAVLSSNKPITLTSSNSSARIDKTAIRLADQTAVEKNLMLPHYMMQRTEIRCHLEMKTMLLKLSHSEDRSLKKKRKIKSGSPDFS